MWGKYTIHGCYGIPTGARHISSSCVSLETWTFWMFELQRQCLPKRTSLKGRLQKSGNLLRQMILYVYSIYRHIYIYIHTWLSIIWIESWGVEKWLPQGWVFFRDPGSLRNENLPLCYWEGGGVIHVHLDLFAAGLLSSRDAARSVFWVLQAWPVGPVGFHRFMPRTSDAKSIYGSMRDGKQNGRTQLSFFLLQNLDFNHSSPKILQSS